MRISDSAAANASFVRLAHVECLVSLVSISTFRNLAEQIKFQHMNFTLVLFRV